MDSPSQDTNSVRAAPQPYPLYRSHKQVRAFKIAAIESAPADQERMYAGGDWILVPEHDWLPKQIVGHEDFVVRHKPQVGGYFVEYEDGYRSFSPAKAFEDGYVPVASPPTTPYPGDGPVSEAELVATSAAPRITPADIEANIGSWWYFTAAEGAEGAAAAGTPYAEQPPVGAGSPLRLLTFCVLVLRNGFTVVGQSACASPANFNAEIGKRIAREDAVRQCWPLMGYELRSKLASRAQYGTSP